MKFRYSCFLFFVLIFNVIQLFAQETITTPVKKISGHTQDIQAIIYSPDGKYMVSGGWDRTIKVWNPESGDLIKDFRAHDAAITCMSFSRDSKFLISASRDNSIKIWDVNWNEKFRLYGHQNSINAVLMGPKMKYAYSGAADGMIKIWDLSKNGEQRVLDTMSRPINDMVLSLRGTEIFIATEGPDIYSRAVTGKELLTYSGHTDEVNALDYALNNKYLLSGSSDKTAIIWNVLTGKVEHVLKGHTWKVTKVAFSTDSRFAITGSTDGTVKLWDVATGKELYTFDAGLNAVTALAMSPDISIIANAGMVNSDAAEKHVIYIWDSKQETERNRIARQKREYADSIQRLKDSVQHAKDSIKLVQDSVKKAQDSIKREEKLRKEQEKKNPKPNQPTPTPDTGRRPIAVPVREGEGFTLLAASRTPVL